MAFHLVRVPNQGSPMLSKDPHINTTKCCMLNPFETCIRRCHQHNLTLLHFLFPCFTYRISVSHHEYHVLPRDLLSGASSSYRPRGSYAVNVTPRMCLCGLYLLLVHVRAVRSVHGRTASPSSLPVPSPTGYGGSGNYAGGGSSGSSSGWTPPYNTFGPPHPPFPPGGTCAISAILKTCLDMPGENTLDIVHTQTNIQGTTTTAKDG